MAGIFPLERSMAQRIFENIIFIEEVFAERAEGEIPDIPILELAKSFELARFPSGRNGRKEGHSSRHGFKADKRKEFAVRSLL